MCVVVQVTPQTLCFGNVSPPASAGGDHIKRRGSASHPPRAALQEEGGPGEGGQPGVSP